MNNSTTLTANLSKGLAVKRILTGIKPTGEIQLGNYLGMVKGLVERQNKYEVFLMIADLHAQTVPYLPKKLKQLIYDLTSSLLALGVNPKKTLLFRQSDVPAHLYLYWILGCLAPVGQLQRMHEYKEQGERYGRQGIGAGILMYPVLMAADILIYQADLVPIGDDQVQHLELTRVLMRKFNQTFGQTFKIPGVLLQTETAKVMSLDQPHKKMSKSLPSGNLPIFAPEPEIRAKIKTAVTDSGSEIKYDPLNKPAVSNLMTTYKHLSGQSYQQIEQEFKGKGYAQFKNELTKVFLSHFKAARAQKKQINQNNVDKILAAGAKAANQMANKTLRIVMQKTGLQ